MTRILLGLACLVLTASKTEAQQRIQLPARDQLLPQVSTNHFTFGTTQGSTTALAGVLAVAFDRYNNLYILDGQNRRVLVVDSAGRFVRQFGRPSDGPGEFRLAAGLAVTVDGSVAVHDLRKHAISMFSSSGQFLRMVRYFEPRGNFASGIAAVHGGIVFSVSERRPAKPQGPIEYQTVVYLKSLGNDRDIKSVHRFPPSSAIANSKVVNSKGVVSVREVVRYGGDPLISVLANGTMALHSGISYDIELLDPSGGRTSLVRNLKPRPVTRADKARWREQILRASRSAARGEVVASPQNAVFAKFMSVVTGIRADPRGWFWIQRRNSDGSEQGPIDLITGSGRYLGTLPPQQLPDAISPSGRAAYIFRDALAVERVAVRQLAMKSK